MKGLIISEIERIWARSKTRALLVIYILIISLWSFTMSFWGVGFYDANNTIRLNPLNFSAFILRDIHFILMFVILPMIFADSLNAEHTSGGYRNVMIRPYEKWKFIASKLITQGFVTFVFLFTLFIISNILGGIFLKAVNTTEFFKSPGIYDAKEALIYSIKFYAIEYIILLSALAVESLICTIIPNAVLAILSTVGLFVGSIYVSDNFVFFLSSTKAIFDALGNAAPSSFYIILLTLIITGISGSVVLWEKRDLLF